jgi:hypothetical protein
MSYRRITLVDMTKRTWAIETRTNAEAAWASTSLRFASDSTQESDVARAEYLNDLFGFEKYRVVAA